MTSHATVPGDAVRAAARTLFDRATAAIGRPALSEQALAPLLDPGAAEPGAVSLPAGPPGALQGWAQVLPGHRVWAVELVLDPDLDGPGRDAVAVDLLGQARSLAAAGGSPVLQWWVHQPTDRDDAVAAAAGFEPSRDLHQLKRPLPLEDPGPIVPTRAFRPGFDDSAWLAVNNRAFEWHLEQGGWTQSELDAHRAEPWFDADDFRVYDDPETGKLAGFNWTKVHAGLDPVEGEIYVIGVDPDYASRGLGRALTVAGLDWLHRTHGITVGMLYVDGSNTAAMTLYDHLAFTSAGLDRAYAATLAGGAGTGPVS